MQSWFLFYVASEQDALSCVQWFNGLLIQPPCFFFRNWPSITAASQFRQISVTAFPTFTGTQLVMVYLDPSNRINVLHGFFNPPATWSWNNVTSRFTSVASDLDKYGLHLADPCTSYSSPNESQLYCSTRSDNGPQSTGDGGFVLVNFFITASGKLKVPSGLLPKAMTIAVL